MYNIFPHIMYYLPGPHNQIFANFEKLRALVKEMAKAHQASLDPNCPRDFIDCFLLKMQQVRVGFVVPCGGRGGFHRRRRARVLLVKHGAVAAVRVQFEEGERRQRCVPLCEISPAGAVQRLNLRLSRTQPGGCKGRGETSLGGKRLLLPSVHPSRGGGGQRGGPPFSHIGFLSPPCPPSPPSRAGKSNG